MLHSASLKPKSICLACALALGALSSAYATTVQDDENVHELSPVTVEDSIDELGKTTLNAVTLDMLPSSTGTISDAFRGQSFIQFDATSRNNAMAGEITPPLISIRGSRNYENAFLINGLSNNNLISPHGFNDNPTNLYGDPTGDAQSIMLDVDMLENLTVYSENISAEYGDFTGGVVDARIRDAKTDRWHAKVWTRHTRDAWTKMHLTEDQEGKEFPVSSDNLQKEFKKTKVGVSFEGPLMDGKLGALMSYEKTHSSVPVYAKYSTKHYHEEKSKRDKDNFMLRLNTDKNADFYVAGTLMYSPYEHTVFMNGRKDGKREIQGGGISFTLNSLAKLSVGQWSNDISFSKTDVSWDSDTNISKVWSNTQPSDYIDWTTSSSASEGMIGDRDQTQTSINYKSILELKPVRLGMTEHEIRVGAEALHTKVEYDMQGYTAFKNDSWRTPHYDSTVQGSLDNGIVAGSQWLDTKIVYDALTHEADYTSFAGFLEDTIKIERITLRPGVRVSYDDVTENVNVAPRFTFKADVLNNGLYEINGGFNRYYGTEILTYAISASQRNQEYVRTRESIGTQNEWTAVDGTLDEGSYGELGELDTPYSDEYVLGASAQVMGAVVKLQGVYRDYKDQLTTDMNTGEFGNGGSSEYKGISLAIEKAFDLGVYGRHYAEFSITNSELEGNSMSWADSWRHDAGVEGWGVDPHYVYIDGEKVAYGDVPANNFNSEWVATYTHRSFFMNDRLRTTVLARYESASDGLKEDWNGMDVDGIHYAKFETIHNDSLINVDLNVDYDLIKTANSTLTVSLEALNLFDHKSEYTANGWSTNYSLGRQFFLGMTYNY